ncbi:hypothetical protein OH77DRAFT_116882 [Trametes cingulata]|nr:hypothetical protein OH77DRAFT_116882 [Trametes cingulata]
MPARRAHTGLPEVARTLSGTRRAGRLSHRAPLLAAARRPLQRRNPSQDAGGPVCQRAGLRWSERRRRHATAALSWETSCVGLRDLSPAGGLIVSKRHSGEFQLHVCTAGLELDQDAVRSAGQPSCGVRAEAAGVCSQPGRRRSCVRQFELTHVS